ncbi:MAG: hypothetical protein IJM97_08265 [Clostridia bacterium]|nr:hypothetical protein [Clostridia bacterium]
MRRLDFYKKYYEITDRIYTDRIVWYAKEHEKYWRKGQFHISKTERRFSIATQYGILLATIILFAIRNYWGGAIGCLWFLCSSIITTDFSIIKIEILYHIYNSNNLYTNLLYQAFLEKPLELPQTKKQISGFVRINRNKLVAKYCVVFRKKHEKVFLIITPFKIKLKSKSLNIVFNDRTKTLDEISDDISEALKNM